MPKNINQIAVRGVSCSRAEKQLFDDLSLTLSDGEALQISGANGSGKSTLLRILAGFIAPDVGTVEWNGTALEQTLEPFRAEVSYLGHRRGLCDESNAQENLALARSLAANPANFASVDLLTRVGLKQHAGTPARFLSAGQSQRLVIARLLIQNTRLWLLDEPFTALDSDGRALVEEIISEHVNSGGLVIIATHQAINLRGLVLQELKLKGAA